jgi:hypothetical protein
VNVEGVSSGRYARSLLRQINTNQDAVRRLRKGDLADLLPIRIGHLDLDGIGLACESFSDTAE